MMSPRRPRRSWPAATKTVVEARQRCCSGSGSTREGHQSAALPPAHPTKAAGGRRVTGVGDSIEPGGCRSHGHEAGVAAVHGEAKRGLLRLRRDLESTRVLWRRAEELGSARLAGHGDGRSSMLVGRRLEGAGNSGKRGKRSRSSQRLGGEAQRGRGGAGASESTAAVVGAKA